MTTLTTKPPTRMYHTAAGRVWQWGDNTRVGSAIGVAYEQTVSYVRYTVVMRTTGNHHQLGRFVQVVDKRDLSAEELDALRNWTG